MTSRVRGQELPRRRLLWLGGSLVLSGLGAGAWQLGEYRKRRIKEEAAAVWSARQGTTRCNMGELEEARRLAEEALQRSPRYAPALLLQACVALEEGRLDDARGTLESEALRSLPESSLLLRLAERRSQGEGWARSFARAWSDSGHPDFRQGTLLLLEERPVDPRLYDSARLWPAWEQASAEARFVLALFEGDLLADHSDWLSEQLPAVSSVTLLVSLVEMLHASDADPKARGQLLPALQERLLQLAGASSQVLQVALLPLLAGTAPEAPLEPPDLEALERLVSLPRWRDTSDEQTFLDFLMACQQLPMARPAHHAWCLTQVSWGLFAIRWLVSRLEATLPRHTQEGQRWMGRMLWQVGSRLCEQPSLLEREWGWSLLERGARAMRDGNSLRQAARTMYDTNGLRLLESRSALRRWPLPSLQEELCESRARGEAAFIHALGGEGELP